MDKTNSENMGILFPMLHSHIVHYYPTSHCITCEIRIRVNEETANNLLSVYPVTINKVGKRLWLQTIYDVPYQEYMPAEMNKQFTLHLSKLQLMVAHWKFVKQKRRIDHLHKQMNAYA